MKLEKEELIKKVNEKVMDEDVKIELMEDITDSFDTSETETKSEDTARIEELEEKYKNLQEKYKERFLKGDETDKKDEEPEDVEEYEEKEIVDIKEI